MHAMQQLKQQLADMGQGYLPEDFLVKWPPHTYRAHIPRQKYPSEQICTNYGIFTPGPIQLIIYNNYSL